MLQMNSDYLEGCHPAVLNRLFDTNLEQSPGYGLDRHCEHAAELIREAFAFSAAFEGTIPGAAKRECGNYLEHDLAEAKREAAAYLRVLENCSENTMVYPE